MKKVSVLTILMGVILLSSGVIAQQKVFIYGAEGLRDPFKPFLRKEEPVKPKGVAVSPLQQYELSQLKLVAIIVGDDHNRAMVEDSEGKGYIIRVGDYVGNRFGRVKEILADRVIIEEKYKDVLGRFKKRQVILFLHPEKKE
ncbi:MAG: hypothetical protein DRG31_01480 [Deltaproteobacteria bacterium]|nr:MAG: hypothetical protein DRG31_01480 [Deltaproteobacteria bacterium]